MNVLQNIGHLYSHPGRFDDSTCVVIFYCLEPGALLMNENRFSEGHDMFVQCSIVCPAFGWWASPEGSSGFWAFGIELQIGHILVTGGVPQHGNK